jgi:hypothetical protein
MSHQLQCFSEIDLFHTEFHFQNNKRVGKRKKVLDRGYPEFIERLKNKSEFPSVWSLCILSMAQ